MFNRDVGHTKSSFNIDPYLVGYLLKIRSCFSEAEESER
jgi:hypothetical protein